MWYTGNNVKYEYGTLCFKRNGRNERWKYGEIRKSEKKKIKSNKKIKLG